MDTYARADVTFVRGEGCRLWDDAGREYLDCLGGLAVVAAGHANPAVADAVAAQMRTLVHVSNLFWTQPMADLARRLRALTGWGNVFFANSGAEANECAVKLVRKWAGSTSRSESRSGSTSRSESRSEIVAAHSSFHGRTLATLAATGQPAKWEGFAPLPAGFTHVPFGDVEALDAAVGGQTAAVLLEPVQGEGGVRPAPPGYLQAVRDLTRERGVALVFDEVQTGMGRTGTWWAFQGEGVTPDVFTVAKGLANGLPIGACIASDDVAAAFGPGSHATTFGGGPVPCAAALATIAELERASCPEIVTERGAALAAGLEALPFVDHVRGRGLLLAAELTGPFAAGLAAAALAAGLVVNAVTPSAIRFSPPLVISPKEIATAAARLVRAREALAAEASL